MNILIILPNWLGDCVMLTPSIWLIKKIFVGSNIYMVGNNLSASLFTLSLDISKIFIDDTKHSNFFIRLKNTNSLAKKLTSCIKDDKFDICFNFRNHFFSSFLAFRTSSIRIGYGSALLLNYSLEKKYSLPPFCTHQVLSYASLLTKLLDIKSLNIKERLDRLQDINTNYLQSASKKQQLIFKKLSNLSLNLKDSVNKRINKHKIILLSPSASYGESKMWPYEYYALCAISLLQQDYEVILLGASLDVLICKKIQDLVYEKTSSKRFVNLAGKTSLKELIDLMSRSDFFIGNDSGLSHIANALDLKSIVLFGPTLPSFALGFDTLPPRKEDGVYFTKNTISLFRVLPCSGCKKRVCPLKHHNCLRLITPQEVLRYVKL